MTEQQPEQTIRFYLEATEPDWIVLRAAADLPSGMMPAGLDGVWINKPPRPPLLTSEEEGSVIAVFTPTGRFETREEDGAVAEVYELRAREL